MVSKRLLILLVMALGIFVSLTFFSGTGKGDGIYANNTNTTLNSSHNYTGFWPMNFTVYANSSDNIINISCYYNITGGAAGNDSGTSGDSPLFAEFINETANQTIFINTSANVGPASSVQNTTQYFNISGLQDSQWYNISCFYINATNATITNWSRNNITIDTRGPNVSITMPLDGANISGTLIVFNVTVNDSFFRVVNVSFNISNSSATLNWNGTLLPVNDTADVWNGTLNTSDFLDGVYNITVWANDSQNNSNNSVSINNVYFDSTAPVVTVTLNEATATTLELTASTSDLTGINGTCTTDRTGASVAGRNTMTITEDSLTCGTDYAYTVTCTDYAGNSGSSSATTFSTTACDSGGGGTSSGGGGTGSGTGGSAASTFTWTSTYKISNAAELESGVSQSLGAKARVKVTLGNIEHHVGVKSLTATAAVIEIASGNPVEITLDVGEDAKVDVDGDGYYDLYVKLENISGGEANFMIQKVYEKVPEDTGGSESPGIDTTGDITGEEDKGGMPTWGWVLIIIIILIVIGGGIAAAKKRK